MEAGCWGGPRLTGGQNWSIATAQGATAQAQPHLPAALTLPSFADSCMYVLPRLDAGVVTCATFHAAWDANPRNRASPVYTCQLHHMHAMIRTSHSASIATTSTLGPAHKLRAVVCAVKPRWR